MKVREFNTEKGLYRFEMEEIDSKLHKHPALEVLFVEQGDFSIITTDKTYSQISFAVIDRNIPHQVISNKGMINLLMFEFHPHKMKSIFEDQRILLKDGIYHNVYGAKESALIKALQRNYEVCEGYGFVDERVNKCIAFFNTQNLEYQSMLSALQQEVFLSASRLSHLFKSEVGISLKKYLIWSKLKKVSKHFLNGDENHAQIAAEYGFYDQAHMSKAFKEMLGISPSHGYNSRTLQDYSKE